MEQSPSTSEDPQTHISTLESSTQLPCNEAAPQSLLPISEDTQQNPGKPSIEIIKTTQSLPSAMESNIHQEEVVDVTETVPLKGYLGIDHTQPLTTKLIPYKVKDKFKPRQYQLELALPGIQGKNCIVCAPTGTGKTLVAALVIANHLNQRQGKGKVVFVVPTQPLAKQQQKSLQDFIPLARVACCVGDDTGGTIRMAITNSEVVVCTSGKLWDELEREMNERRLNFTHFSLMVIDECHNTRKSSPQARIMTKYLKEKLRENSVSLPQVLGLTASPGAGDSKVPRLDSTYDHLISLCALMDATEGIVTVKSNRSELERFTKKSTSTLKHYSGRDTNECFIQEVMKVMKRWEKDIDLSTTFKQWEQRYETFIQKNRKELESSPVPMREKFSILEYLQCLAQVLSIYMKLRHEDAMGILNDFVMHCPNGSISNTEQNIVASLEALKITLSSIVPVPNPLLEQVKQELLARFSQNPSSRAIVFASTKKQVSCICEWIANLPPDHNLKPRVVVGHTDDTGSGMTDPEKEEALAGFREGRYNILVATSVLEEGIDVPACNLVIRYEHVTNEIAKVQAEGRARAENSEGITIVSNASNKMYKEMLNEEKDQVVKETMEYIPTGERLEELMKEKQHLIMNRNEMKMWLEEGKQRLGIGADRERAVLKCKKCKVEVCHGRDLYTLQSGGYDVIVLNKSFLEDKARKKPHPRPRQGTEGYSAAKDKIYCMSCDADWGVVGIQQGNEFPVLKCKSFNYEIQGVPVKLSKWSEAPFRIPPLIAHPDFQSNLMHEAEDDDQDSII